MCRHFTSIFCSVAFSSAATFACAEEVTLAHNGLTLLADLVVAEDASGPIALITHGTLAHKDMELVEALQDSLSEQGVSSLAHTLSLGVDTRRGMYDCAVPHIHRDEDADAEIAAWVGWLRDANYDQIALVGHSRGGKQVARAASKHDNLAAVILMAPATQSGAEQGRARYPDLDQVQAKVDGAASEAPVAVPRLLYCDDAMATPASFKSYHTGEPRGADSYISEIDAPILVIAADKDTVVPEVPATFMPLRGGTLQFALIEDAGHMFLDFAAEDAATQIAEFLSDLPEEVDHDDFETANKDLYEGADLAYGEYLGSECLSCHKVDAEGGVPPVEGLEAWYTHLALIQYANGERENDAMRLVARSLDDEQRIAVSAYFSSLQSE